jgi:serine/threonine protein kinase
LALVGGDEMSGRATDIGVDEVYFAALEYDEPEARAAYLVEVCGADFGLRRRVERLLEARSERGSFLEVSPYGPTIDIAPTGPVDGPGTSVGPYKLMEQIGEGGMGTVYVAEQTAPVRRRVALKVIKPGMDTRQVIARFEAERQALAMMDHPNIAKVLDGGATEAGRPYFVMELVRGIPITDYCDREQLSIPDRLDLFVLVCRAVQHAHQKGVIHRDLKPSNILVTVIDGAAVPRVIDFGVAKATGAALTDRTLYTGFHQFVGTPLYMSPEQADLSGADVDTRSDIYSLGVLLYELLTGTTPFDRETFGKVAFDEMRRIVREDEPPKPSMRLSSLGETLTTTSMKRSSDPRHLNRSVRGELDWIAMKALEKDRKRRYETANDFASDVMRYLTDQPVEACPPSARYRVHKFVRRNMVALTTTALVVAALLIGTVVSTWQAIRATEAKQAEAAQRQRAEANFEKAREAVDKMLTRVADRLGGTPQMEKVRAGLLQDALTFHQGFLQEQSDDPEVRFQTARAYYQVARIQVILGRFDQSEQAWRQAIRISEELTTAFPGKTQFTGHLASCRLQLGWVLRDQGRLREAEALFRQSGGGWELLSLAFSLFNTNRLKEAEDTCQKALADAQSSVLRASENEDHRLRLAHCHSLLGSIQSATNRPGEAEKSFQRALEILEKLVEGSSRQIAVHLNYLATTHNSLGNLMDSAGRLPEAEKAFRASAAVSERLVTDFPNTPRHWYDHACAYGNLSYLLRKTDRLEEAEESARKVSASSEKLMAAFPDQAVFRNDLGANYHNWGEHLWTANRPGDAEPYFREARRIFEKLAADFPRNEQYRYRLLGILGVLARVHSEIGQHAEADKLGRQSLVLAEKIVVDFPSSAEHHLGLLLAYRSVGRVQYRGGDYTAAVESLKKAVKCASEYKPDRAGAGAVAGIILDKEGDVEPWLFLAMAHWQLGDKAKARTWYDQAVQWMDEHRPHDQSLRRLRAEAAGLLDVKDGPKSEEQPSPK